MSETVEVRAVSEQHPSASSTLAQEDVQCDAVAHAATLPTTTEVLNGMLRDAPAHRSQQQSQRIASHEMKAMRFRIAAADAVTHHVFCTIREHRKVLLPSEK